MDLYALHEKMTGHLFPAYSNSDERFLALALRGDLAFPRSRKLET